MYKKGFTLIELIAVILIMGIISLIAIFTVNKIIETAHMESYKVSVKSAINAVDYYLSANDFADFPESNIDVKILPLDNVEQFISGKIIKNIDNEYEAVNVTNGRYCVSGVKEDLRVSKNCFELDITAPILDETKIISLVTTNSIKITVPSSAITEEETEIKNYKFELINESLDVDEVVEGESNTNTFVNLVNATEYTVIITITNQNNLSTTKELTLMTLDIDVPTYSVNPSTTYAVSKTVTVTYPERQTGFIYTYSIDGGTSWTTVDSGTTAVINFTTNGTIIARIYDGTNYKNASSYTVSGIDPTGPTASIAVSTKTYTSINVSVTAADSESGIDIYEYAIDSDSYVNYGTSSTYTFAGVSQGNHTLKVRVTNGAGITTEASIIASPNAIVYTYAYTGGVQFFTAPVTGYYKIEVWGASGGGSGAGRGAYAIGAKLLSANDSIYIYVGGAGKWSPASSFNGGGVGYGSIISDAQITGGGGATDVRTTQNSSYANRIIVAGGGGATWGFNYSYGYGGGGPAYAGLGISNYYAANGAIGGTGSKTDGGCWWDSCSNSNYKCGFSGGGGGGYTGGRGVKSNYGDMSEHWPSNSVGSAEGGTNYIGGVTSYGSLTAKSINGNLSMPTYSGTSTMTGNAGNGYAKISYLGA